MSAETAILDAAWASIPSARAQIRIDGQAVVARALCSGVGRTKESSDYGRALNTSDMVRCKTADIPAGKLGIGNVIEVSVAAGSYEKVRIAGRKDFGGVSAFTVEAVNA